ncbi:MAG: ribose-5-phosphate isomerase RpiA [Candidatus Xenobia bacterium]
MSGVKLTQDAMKEAAGRAAAHLVEPGMRLGLGTGSTVQYFLDELGSLKVANLQAVPTSTRTANRARELGIQLMEPFEDFVELDLAIDGADEVSPQGHLTKGGGGAHMWEKLVALAAKRFVVIVDETKMVQKLGAFPLPVEVIPFGWRMAQRHLEGLGGKPVRRMKDGQVFRTDSGNYLLDCHFGIIADPPALHETIKQLPGVVDSGLFIGITTVVMVGHSDGTVERINIK